MCLKHCCMNYSDGRFLNSILKRIETCVCPFIEKTERENEREKRYFNQTHTQRPTVFCLIVRSVSHSLIIRNTATMKHIQRHRTSVCMEFITDKRTFSTATNLDSSIQNVALKRFVNEKIILIANGMRTGQWSNL